MGSSQGEAHPPQPRGEFPDAVGVLEDPLALTISDPRKTEQRFVTIGVGYLGRVLTVVWTERSSSVRIISARPSTKRERRQYEEGE